MSGIHSNAKLKPQLLMYGNDTKGTAVFELSSVSISMDKFKELYGDDTHIRLCGYIKLVDDCNNEFYFFNQEESSAKVVDLSKNHLDILQGHRHTHPLMLPEKFTIYMFLRDKNREKPIIDESFELCFSDDVKYDKEQCYKCESIGSVNYTIFQYAMLAYVNVLVCGTESREVVNKVSSGTISATYKLGNKTGLRTFSYDPYPSELHRNHRTSWFAVPSYSSFLKFKAVLKIDGTDWSADFKFEVCDVQTETYCWESAEVGPDLTLYMEVAYRHPFYLIDGPKSVPTLYKYDITEKKSWVLENSKALSWHLIEFERDVAEEPEQRYRSDLSPSPLSTHQSLSLVEVYSVSVYAYDKHPLSLYGTIEYSSRMGEIFYMFKRDKGHAVEVNSGDYLPLINADCCYLGGSFNMSLNLKDSRGRKIIKGNMVWRYNADDGWYYRMISSVFPSRLGYAAVQYSLFPDAIQAKLKIVFVSPMKDRIKVCGRICTRYENFKYFSHSEKIYESVCFERSHSNCVEVSGGEEIPLSKYAVVAPLGVHLIVNVDLCVYDGSEITLLRATTKIFQPPRIQDKTEISESQEIRKNLYGVDVSMEWNGYVRSCKKGCSLKQPCCL